MNGCDIFVSNLPRWYGFLKNRCQKKKLVCWQRVLGGGFKYFLFSPRKLGEDESNSTSIFFKGVGQPPTRVARHDGRKKSWNFIVGILWHKNLSCRSMVKFLKNLRKVVRRLRCRTSGGSEKCGICGLACLFFCCHFSGKFIGVC